MILVALTIPFRYTYVQPVEVTGTFIEVQCGGRSDYHTHFVPRQDVIDNYEKTMKRKEKEGKGGEEKPLNVILLMVDALSRVNAHDKLPKTMDYFESMKGDLDSSADIFEFFRFSAVGAHTGALFHQLPLLLVAQVSSFFW